MKKVIACLLAMIFLCQSCQVYKSRPINEVIVGKTYRVALKNGVNMDAVCHDIQENDILFKKNDNIVSFPKDQITSIKLKKVSALRVVGGVVLTAVGVFLIFNNNDKKSTGEATIDPN